VTVVNGPPLISACDRNRCQTSSPRVNDEATCSETRGKKLLEVTARRDNSFRNKMLVALKFDIWPDAPSKVSPAVFVSKFQLTEAGR
jgi:hypothetical protein